MSDRGPRDGGLSPSSGNVAIRSTRKGAAESGPATHWMGPVFVTVIGGFMAILDSSIVTVAIPAIKNVFDASTSNVQWIMTIYLLVMGVVVPLTGWLGDRIGYKRLYILAVAAFTFGSLLCSVSWSLTSLIVARVVQGLGGGMIMPISMAMVYRMVPRERIGSAMGMLMIALLMGPAIGPTLGGYFVEYVDWRWIFTINLPIGVIAIFLSIAMLPEFPIEKGATFDLPGALTSAVGLFCLLLALSKGSDWGWGAEQTVLLFYVSAASLSLFVYLELTSPHPLLDLRVFKYRTFTFANIAVIILSIGMYAGLFYLPLFLQTIRGLGAMQTGLLLMPGALLSGAMMPLMGRLYDKIGPRPLVIPGLLLLAVLTYTFSFLNLQTSYSTILVWVLIRGGVLAMAMMPTQTVSLSVIPTQLVGRASAMTNVVRSVSTSFGLAALTALLTQRMAFHVQNLSNRVIATNAALPEYMRGFSAHSGGYPAHDHTVALDYLYSHIQQLSFSKGIDDVFIVAAGITVLGIVPALFLRKGTAGTRGAVEGG